MNSTPKRASYEARILVVPLGASGADLVDTMVAGGLTSVRIAADAENATTYVRDINDAPGTEIRETIADVAASSDMMVLLGQNLPEVPLQFAATMADAARANGLLLAGVLVDPQEWESPMGAETMAGLRRELDMLVSVKEASLATSLVDVLKGGRRKPIVETEPSVDRQGHV